MMRVKINNFNFNWVQRVSKTTLRKLESFNFEGRFWMVDKSRFWIPTVGVANNEGWHAEFWLFSVVSFSASHLFLPRDRGERVLQVHLLVRWRGRGQDHLRHVEAASADCQTRSRASRIAPDRSGHNTVWKMEVDHPATFFKVKI